MQYVVIFVVCLSLVVATSLIHYEVLRGASALAPKLEIPARQRTLLTIAAAFFAHSVEIALYAVTYWACASAGLVLALTGAATGHFYDYFYFSAATFTTLGHGGRGGRRAAAAPDRDPVAERPRPHHLVGLLHLPLDGEVLAGRTL